MGKETIDFYNKYAEEFCRSTVDADVAGLYDRFLKYIPEGGRILDLGCGSGRDSKAFLEMGYHVTSVDGSIEMCRIAEQYIGHPVRCCRFDEIDYHSEFDGIWACASLLHVKKAELGAILRKLELALCDNGVLYASFKHGDEERTDAGRIYSDYTLERLKKLVEGETTMRPVELYISEDILRGNRRKWSNIIIQK